MQPKEYCNISQSKSVAPTICVWVKAHLAAVTPCAASIQGNRLCSVCCTIYQLNGLMQPLCVCGSKPILLQSPHLQPGSKVTSPKKYCKFPRATQWFHVTSLCVCVGLSPSCCSHPTCSQESTYDKLSNVSKAYLPLSNPVLYCIRL